MTSWVGPAGWLLGAMGRGRGWMVVFGLLLSGLPTEVALAQRQSVGGVSVGGAHQSPGGGGGLSPGLGLFGGFLGGAGRAGPYEPGPEPSFERGDWSQPREGRQHASRRQELGPRHPGIDRNDAHGSPRPGFYLPSAGERRFLTDELVLEIPGNTPSPTLEAVARRHHLTRMGSQKFTLTGRTLYRWHIDDGRAVADVIRELKSEARISAAQPNYIYTLQDQASTIVESIEGDPAQYAIAKLHLTEAHHLATGDRVVVAMIDSAVDPSQPELTDVIAASFDAVGSPAIPDAHGTAMAGAIAAHGKLLGAAPRVRLLAIRAFGDSTTGPQGTTFNIIRGLDWAGAHGARIVNMSFAGPSDPALRNVIASAHKKGLVLVAAAGNAGPKSPPLYPAADPNVIAVTATDAQDKLFAQANRGSYVALAAPGVDVLVPAPHGGMQLTSGTSVAAAQVSGITALMLERNPSLTPDEVRKGLTASARRLGPKVRDNDFGAGLANAFQAVKVAEPRSAEQQSSGLPRPR